MSNILYGRKVANPLEIMLPLGVPVLPLVYITIAGQLPRYPESVSLSSRLEAESAVDLIFSCFRLYAMAKLAYTSAMHGEIFVINTYVPSDINNYMHIK